MSFFILNQVKRDILILTRNPLLFLVPVLFFVLVCVLFPLSVSVDASHLQLMGAGVIWIGLLLAHLLSLSHLFQEDYEDGSLDQWLVGGSSSLLVKINARLISHALFFAVPLLLLAPLVAILYGLSFFGIQMLCVSLILGMIVIYFQSAIIAANQVTLQKNGLLLAIILLPLYIPTLIFATTLVNAAEQGFPITSQLAWLGALCLFAITLGPYATAFALRVGVTF